MNNNIIDLFSGVGGLSLGFKKAGFKISFANEIDKEIAEAYQDNSKKTVVLNEDITKLDIPKTFKEYKGNVTGIIGGPPCQGFSQKGERKTILDERNYLFHYFVKIVAFVAPRFFVMENVPNLLTAEEGAFKEEIYNLFEDLGYTVKSTILNAADYGVPQNRRRAFIIGYKGMSEVNFPEAIQEKVTAWEAISDLSYLGSGEGEYISEYKYSPQSTYQLEMRKNSMELYNHNSTKHSETTLKRLELIPQEGDRTSLPSEHMTKSIYSGTWCRIVKDKPTVTITTRFDTPSSGRFTHPYLNRAITVREAARIQSFPDNFIFRGTKSSQMKQVGNAVPPKLAEAIAHEILQSLNEE